MSLCVGYWSSHLKVTRRPRSFPRILPRRGQLGRVVWTVTDTIVTTVPTKTKKLQQQQVEEQNEQNVKQYSNIWALFALSICYLHHSVTGFVLPAILPYVSQDLKLTDLQGGSLTLGYTLLYALALTPAGILVDKLSRPQLLAAGSAGWSLLTQFAAKAHNFQELLLCRVGFACAQAVQNPICFTLIPELFPNKRATAMALYNSAIYLGRSLSFTFALLCSQAGLQNPFSVQMVPIDNLDVATMSILYTTGDMVAVVPLYNYDFQIIYDIVDKPQAWRTLLEYLGVPGLIIAAAILVLVKEQPSHQAASIGDLIKAFLGSISAKRFKKQVDAEMSRSLQQSADLKKFSKNISNITSQSIQYTSTRRQYSRYRKLRTVKLQTYSSGKTFYPDTSKLIFTKGVQKQALQNSPNWYKSNKNSGLINKLLREVKNLRLKERQHGKLGYVPRSQNSNKDYNIFGSVSFIALTVAAGLNDVGSWAMIAWHATFYERAFELSADVYAPLLAFVIPLGGIMGGVGGGLLADKLSLYGKRSYLTVGALMLAVPFMTSSFLTDSYQLSFFCLLLGFALSEAWRAPAAIMVRSTVPAEKVGYASAVHLSIRNLVGGLGPLGVALLISKVGVQQAMTLVPACYFLSALGFWWVESVIED
eukprot:TRINITY_DN4377_c0_g1_i1.p1 TRINITY_DN4377_c0_g1~~TRINITY_DN4377_c0_g1_i1.p1  ORF type:complete len:647 (-),score=52.89 TRINITY_DN4377_c0_g1_i1:793-2733(-)